MIEVQHVCTEEQLIDILTKSLPRLEVSEDKKEYWCANHQRRTTRLRRLMS
jgi:hypothetical protein